MQYWIGPMNYFMLASRGCFIQDKSTWYYITTLCACFGWIIIVKLLRWIDLKSRYYILHTPSHLQPSHARRVSSGAGHNIVPDSLSMLL